MTSGLTVALVGPNYHENLALEYLAAAAQRSQHRARVVAYGSRSDAASAVAAILRLNPDLVGISIAFQSCLGDSLFLAQQLRQAGFAGHITCGGHVPSFEFAALLRDCPAIDTVVRYEGELTLLELLERLAQRRPLLGVAGLVWRDQAELRVEPVRCAVRALDELTWPLRSSEPRRFAGIVTNFVIGSRGCVGDCAYCCIAAFSRDVHGPAYRLRSPADIAREIAELSDKFGTRAVFLQDDLFVLPAQSPAIERIWALARCLSDVGAAKCAFWAKARPDSITPALVAAAQQLGIIHLFLGIENHAQARLQYLGRSHAPADNERALALLRESQMGVSFNIMLFDPDCSLDDVAINLDFMAANLDLPWNICRTELYSGTELLQRIKGEGRLLGDYRNYGYVMRDPRAELMFRVLRVCFRQRAFDATSLLNQVISLCFGYQLHQSLFPGPDSDRLAAEIQNLTISVHSDTVDTLRHMLDYAGQADLQDSDTARRFAVKLGLDINQRDLPWRRQAEHYTRLLDARGQALT